MRKLITIFFIVLISLPIIAIADFDDPYVYYPLNPRKVIYEATCKSSKSNTVDKYEISETILEPLILGDIEVVPIYFQNGESWYIWYLQKRVMVFF